MQLLNEVAVSFHGSVLFNLGRLHTETTVFFLISSLIRFYYDNLKVMFKNGKVFTLLEYWYVLP